MIALAVTAPVFAEATTERSGVAGQVRGGAEPLDAARVYVYHLTDFRLEKAVTDAAGRFLFEGLPAGLFKVIAYKGGFVPAVVQLTRSAADSYQYLDLELAQAEAENASDAETFWAVRSKIPADVLREITLDELGDGVSGSGDQRSATELAQNRLILPAGLKLNAEMKALTGVDQITAADGQMFGGQVGIEGQLGNLQIGLAGNYRQLQSRDLEPTSGLASALSLNLASGDDTRVSVTSLSNRLNGFQQSAEPIDFEHYQVSVSQALGENSRTQVTAQYTDETHFYRQGLHDPVGIPDASRVFRLAGSYALKVGDGTHLETGLRFWQRAFERVGAAVGSTVGNTVGTVVDSVDPLLMNGDERVDFYGRGDTRLQPAVLVEYGLYTRLTDGSLSLAPRGGVVVNLGSGWKASTTASHRVQSGEPFYDFLPTLQRRNDDCAESEEYCYRLLFSRTNRDRDEEISFGALQREYAETLRLYFSDDFFDRLESLYLVPGDRLPEVQFAWTRKLSPNVLTRLESNVASGGGGIFYTTDREPFENEVRYLVTSLDTHFQSSSTGLFIAFHHLQQQLNPVVASPLSGQDPLDAMELDRLELMLTQDLNVLLNLSRNWAVQLNMELTRGSDLFEGQSNDDELRKRILGGIAVKF